MSKRRIKELNQEIAELTEKRNAHESDLNIWCPICKKGTRAKNLVLFRERYAVHWPDGTDWETSKDVEYVCRHCERVITIRRISKHESIHKLATTYCESNLVYKGWADMGVDHKKKQFHDALTKEKEKKTNE